MNLNSDEKQDDIQPSSEEQRRAKAIEEIVEMATLKTSDEMNQPRFF